jgi:hypothetical protein
MFPLRAAAIPIIGLSPSSTNTSVLAIETAPFSAATIGLAGFPSLSGLDVQPGTGLLYASSGFTDGGRLFRVDATTGAASLVGATGMAAVAGLAFDTNGTLYGTVSTSLAVSIHGLAEINPVTGAGAFIGDFGSHTGTPIVGIDSIAVHPLTGILYGSSSTLSVEGSLFTIDKGTGAATLLGILNGTGGTGDAWAGMAFDQSGQLYGSFGGGDGRIASIDIDTLTVTFLGDAASGSVSDIAIIPTPVVPSLSSLGIAMLGGLMGLSGWRRLRT